jgi:hypothetical protein
MKYTLVLAIALSAVASACSYTERTVVEKPVPVATSTVTYSDPAPAPAVVYVPAR